MMTKCEFDKNGCSAPIPFTCSDECEIMKLRKQLEEEKIKYESLSWRYESLKKRNDELLREISFVD